MGNIFMSHTEKDFPVMEEIARTLEQAGYTTWFYERDILPGTSYLIQTSHAMESCDAIVLLLSPEALSSDQVSMEVVGAFEKGIPFIPVLIGITPAEFKESQPEWEHAMVGTAMLVVGEEDISPCLSRILDGLSFLGISPSEEKAPSPILHTPATSPPPHLAEKILASRSSLEGERKQVTVVFADVVGFTPLAERLDPEEVHDLIRPAVGIMVEEIHTYEGTIAHFTGDGLMALFGAPLAHEDAPQRAIYAALAMQRRLSEYGVKLSSRGIELSMRIGINTGLVIVGSIGDDLAMEYTALGDTVNLASRMESTAEPGTVQISENTWRLTRGYFEFKDLGKTPVKGKEEPIHAYRALEILPTHSRISASLSRGLSPFVGREKELDQLSDRYAQIKQRQGQVVGVIGEPGVGKSRLLLQFREHISNKEYTYLEGGCIHYGEAIAYLPILGILRKYFDISEGESETESKKKMDGRLVSLNGQLLHILPPLQELLSLKVDDQTYLSLEPVQRRERIFEAIRYLLMAESQHKPLILAIEDMHWIDKTSEEFLSYFIEGIPGANILLLLLYRPEYTPAWVSKTYYRQILVDHLPEEPSTKLVEAILSEGEVSPEISEFIVTKTAGNPLFIEELTRGLLESGSILKDNEHYVLSTDPSGIQVPGTLQGIIASRLDRLPEELKETVQVASVIGREFSLRLLEEVTGLSKPLKSNLMQLQALEFIYEKTFFPEPEYTFKHALTQEVSYESLLLKRRREIHEKIGQAIERLYPDTLEDSYETLAYHYSCSEAEEKACYYLKLSGEKAAKHYSNREAVRFYEEAIQVLEGLPESGETKRKTLEVCRLILDPLRDLVFPEGSLESLEKAEKLAEELDDDVNLASVYSILSVYHSFKGNAILGLEYSEKCFDAAERADDVESMAKIATGISVVMIMMGRFLETADMGHRVLALLEEKHMEKNLFAGGRNIFVNQCGWCGNVLGCLGEFEEGKAILDKGLKVAFEVDDAFGVGWLEFQYSFLSYMAGDVGGTINHARKAIERFEETGVVTILGVTWSLLCVGYIFLGNFKAARDHAERGLEIQKQSGAPAFMPLIYYFFALARLSAGDLEGGLEDASEAVRLSRESGTKAWETVAWLSLGRITGEADPSQVDAAEGHLLQAISLAEELSARPYAAQGYLYLGEVFELAGRREVALQNLRKAEAIWKDMGVDPLSYWLTRNQQALARLSQG